MPINIIAVLVGLGAVVVTAIYVQYRKSSRRRQPQPRQQLTPPDPRDCSFCRSAFRNCHFYGETVLPSGYKVPAPPPGYYWHVDGDVFTLTLDAQGH